MGITTAKKSLGQHFLACEWVIPIMLDAASLSPDDTVLEIGPGTGVLTRAIAARATRVIAIEKDEKLAATLAEQLARERIANVEIHTGDILKKIPPLPKRYKIVANIPYYLTARLLRCLLEEQTQKPTSIVLMIQKEVAERIIARPPHENLLALSVQVFGAPSLVKIVPSMCFHPRPQVDSAIIAISDISDNFFIAHDIRPNIFFNIVRAGFAHKRKLLLNSLAALAHKPFLHSWFQELSISHHARPEELSPVQWAKLAQKLGAHIAAKPAV